MPDLRVKMITIRVAELNIGVKYRYGFTREYLSNYITEGAPDFTVEVTDDDLLRESELAEEPTENEYLEYVAVYPLLRALDYHVSHAVHPCRRRKSAKHSADLFVSLFVSQCSRPPLSFLFCS